MIVLLTRHWDDNSDKICWYYLFMGSSFGML